MLETAKTYIRETYNKIREHIKFGQYVYSRKDELRKDWVKENKFKEKMTNVFPLLEGKDECSLGLVYAGTLNEHTKNKYCGEVLKKIEEKTGHRLKLGELNE
jgi:hypothetical protein